MANPSNLSDTTDVVMDSNLPTDRYFFLLIAQLYLDEIYPQFMSDNFFTGILIAFLR
jgi:hypothetical protein